MNRVLRKYRYEKVYYQTSRWWLAIILVCLESLPTEAKSFEDLHWDLFRTMVYLTIKVIC